MYAGNNKWGIERKLFYLILQLNYEKRINRDRGYSLENYPFLLRHQPYHKSWGFKYPHQLKLETSSYLYQISV